MIPWKSLTDVEKAQVIRDTIQAGGCSRLIAEAHGVTRSTVIGWHHRHIAKVGLTWADSPAKKKREADAEHNRQRTRAVVLGSRPKPESAKVLKKRAVWLDAARKPPTPLPKPETSMTTAAANPVHISQHKAGQCRYPLWGSKVKPAFAELLYCGDPVLEGSESWCPCHHARVNPPPPPSAKKKPAMPGAGDVAFSAGRALVRAA